MSKLPSIEFSVGLAVGVLLYILDKCGKSNAWIHIGLLALTTAFLVHSTLTIPWIWSASEFAMRVWRASLLLCGLVLSVGWFGIWTWPDSTTYRASNSETTSAPAQTRTATVELTGPRFSEKFDKIYISVGGNSLELRNVDGERVALFGLSERGSLGLAGVGFANPTAGGKTTAFPEGGTIPAVAFISDQQLFIDAEVFAGPGQPAMHIRRNELSDRPAKWDKNTDNKHALEIVNENGLAVLQIVYADKARAAIKGVFVNGEAIAVVNDAGIMTVRKDEIAKHISNRLFKYPSWKYPGVFEEDGGKPTP